MATTYLIDGQRFEAAQGIEAYIDSADKNQEFWRGVYRTARVPDDLAARARAVPGVWNLLALSEHSCR